MYILKVSVHLSSGAELRMKNSSVACRLIRLNSAVFVILFALFTFRFDPDQKKRLLLRAHGGELCSRALSIYDNDLGVIEVMDSRGQATSLVRLALLLEEQVK